VSVRPDRKRDAAAVVLSLFLLSHPGAAQPKRLPKKPLDPRAVYSGYVRILCQEADLEEAVRRIKVIPKIDPAIAKSYSLSRKGDQAAALATLNGIPKPIASVPTRFLYWELRGYIQKRLGDLPAARHSLRELLTLGGADTSRVELQTWRFLKELGEKPSEAEGNRVLGVVTQVNTAGHVMAIGGYADGNSRFANDAGAVLLGDKSTYPQEIRDAAAHLPRAAEKYLGQVPLQGDCSSPGLGEVKLALLTPAGIHTKTVRYESLQKSDHPLHGLWTASNNLIELSLNYYKKLSDERAHLGKLPVSKPTAPSKSGPHR
jgi:hypothetical protein